MMGEKYILLTFPNKEICSAFYDDWKIAYYEIRNQDLDKEQLEQLEEQQRQEGSGNRDNGSISRIENERKKKRKLENSVNPDDIRIKPLDEVDRMNVKRSLMKSKNGTPIVSLEMIRLSRYQEYERFCGCDASTIDGDEEDDRNDNDFDNGNNNEVVVDKKRRKTLPEWNCEIF